MGSPDAISWCLESAVTLGESKLHEYKCLRGLKQVASLLWGLPFELFVDNKRQSTSVAKLKAEKPSPFIPSCLPLSCAASYREAPSSGPFIVVPSGLNERAAPLIDVGSGASTVIGQQQQ